MVEKLKNTRKRRKNNIMLIGWGGGMVVEGFWKGCNVVKVWLG